MSDPKDWKKKKIPYKWCFLICAAVLVLTLLPMAAIAGYNHACADDYVYGSAAYHVWQQSHSIAQTLRAALSVVKDYYQNWQGTFISIFLMSLQPSIFGEAYYGIVPFLMLGMLIGGTAFFLKVLLRNVLCATRAQYGLITSIILLLTIQLMDEPVSAFFWYNGSVHYMFMYSLMLFLLGLLLLALVTKSRGKRLACTILSALLALLTGGGNYVIGLTATLGLLSVLAVYVLYKSYKKLYIPGVATLLYAISFGINAAAPGNRIRGTYFTETPGLIESICKSFYTGLEYIQRWFSWPFLIVLLLLLPVMAALIKKTDFTFPCPALAVAYGYCMVSAMFCPTIYTMDQVGPGRSRNVIFCMFVLMLFASVFYVTGWLMKRGIVCIKGEQESGLPLLPTLALCFVFLFFGEISIFLDIHMFSSVSALNSLRIGEAQTYHREAQERLAILEDESIEDAVLMEFSSYPHVLFFDDITENADDWQNTGMASYFDKRSVVREKRQ